MNLYAINVAPINGWETHLARGSASLPLTASAGPAYGGPAKLGAGSSAVAVSASGAGRLLIHGEAALALDVISASGTGIFAKKGAGEADTVLSTAGTGYARIHGDGTTGAVLSGEGDGTVIPRLGGRIRIDVNVSGGGKVAALGAGEVPIVIGMTGNAVIRPAVYGGGEVVIPMDAVGRERLIARGYGAAQVALSGEGAWKAPTTHYGEGLAEIVIVPGRGEHSGWHLVYADPAPASIELSGMYRVPRWPQPSAEYTPAHRSNTVTVPREQQTMRVQRERRTA